MQFSKSQLDWIEILTEDFGSIIRDWKVEIIFIFFTVFGFFFYLN
jgi:hypothetical protein